MFDETLPSAAVVVTVVPVGLEPFLECSLCPRSVLPLKVELAAAEVVEVAVGEAVAACS